MTQKYDDPDHSQTWQVWVDDEKKIASFQPLKGGRLMEFASKLIYVGYISVLIDGNYRFA